MSDSVATRLGELGDAVSRRWERENLREEAFPEIATAALAESKILASLSFADVANWVVSGEALPKQRARKFGQPPITVYIGRDFYIEALIWIDTPTSIHQHAFSGAWGVLQGSSVHSVYGFERGERVCDPLCIGELRFKSAELLRQGDVRTIEAGDRFIHSLVHLESPSVSLVVRTNGLPAYNPQFGYLSPGLAFDPFYASEPLETQLKLLRSAAKAQPGLFRELSEKIVASRDLWYAFKVVELASLEQVEPSLAANLLTILRGRHKALGDVVAPALQEQRRSLMVKASMKKVADEGHRFLLAMLINAPDRDAVRRLVSAEFPGCDPERKVLDWCEELSANGQIDCPLDELSLYLLQFAMRGATFSSILESLGRHFGQEDDIIERARKRWYAINTVELLRPLVRA